VEVEEDDEEAVEEATLREHDAADDLAARTDFAAPRNGPSGTARNKPLERV